ncbi:hypothetical protein O9X98_05070 [Agrobacterium salinitolerans]|nr:hypothetical protein [Agrobacterium salinitolerans]
MEALVRIDDTFIDVVEKALLSARTRLGLSFPRAIAFCGSATLFLMALSVFMSAGNLLTVKIPLLTLYALLAYLMGKTVFRNLAYFNSNWNPDIERILAQSAMATRTKLRPARALFGFFAILSVSFTLMVDLKLAGMGEISLLDAGRDILSSLIGIPVLLAYQYVMCARPSGRPTL